MESSAISLIIAGVFMFLQVLWNVYLFLQNKELVNKLMSRNYHEFKVAENVGKPSLRVETPEEPDQYFEQKAKELNGMFGLGQ